MQLLCECNIFVILYFDLGNNDNFIEFLFLMQYVFEIYFDNKIVWVYMGLLKELILMDFNKYVVIMKDLFDCYLVLMFDIFWDVLFNVYYQWGDIFIVFFNEYFICIFFGFDFVVVSMKDFN